MRKLNKIFLFSILTCFGCVIITGLFVSRQNKIVTHQFPLQAKWIFEAGSQITTTPVVYEGYGLVRTPDKLYGIDLITGQPIWSYPLPNDKHADPPLVQGDKVVLAHLNGTTALRLTTGEVIWQIFDSNTRVDALPVAANEGKVVIVDESILIRDINTGKLIWEIQNPYTRSDAIVKLYNNNLYVVFEDQIRNYNFETGELIWQSKTEEWSLQNGLLANNILYLERLEEGITAFDLSQRKALWSRDNLLLTDYPPAMYNNTLFIGSRGEPPVAIEALTGRTLWEAKGVWSYDNYQTPLIFDNTVYIRGLFQKKIYALNPNNGKLIGYISLGIPDIISNNASYSLGPVQYDKLIIFPAGNKLLAYGK